MVELILAWKIGPRYFLDEAKAWKYARDMAAKYSINRPDAFDPRPAHMLKAEIDGRLGYFIVRKLGDEEKVIDG